MFKSKERTNISADVRIYLEDYNIQNLTPKILERLDEHYKFSKNSVQMYSPSGIFVINNNKITKRIPVDKPIKRVLLEPNTNLCLDESFLVEEEILSQVPFSHYSKTTKEFYYCQGDKSNLYLVVEGFNDNKINSDFLKKQNLTEKNKYLDFVVENLYFLAKEEIDNYLIKKELNVFLSVLK